MRLYQLTIKAPSRNLPPRYNVLTECDGDHDFVRMRWGLVPSWWPKPVKELKAATFNARVGAVAKKPFFRDAFRRTRCLIPASGYYEWQNTASGKQPWYFARAVAITRKPCSMSSSVSSRPKPVEQPVISQIGFCSLSSASVLLHLRTQRSTIAIMFAL